MFAYTFCVFECDAQQRITKITTSNDQMTENHFNFHLNVAVVGVTLNAKKKNKYQTLIALYCGGPLAIFVIFYKNQNVYDFVPCESLFSFSFFFSVFSPITYCHMTHIKPENYFNYVRPLIYIIIGYKRQHHCRIHV